MSEDRAGPPRLRKEMEEVQGSSDLNGCPSVPENPNPSVPEPSHPLDAVVDDWFEQHMRGSVLGHYVLAWNHVKSSLSSLKSRLRQVMKE